MKSLFEQMGGTYTKVNGYLIPDLVLPEEETVITLGRWGMTHKRWLKKNNKIFYTQLLTSGKLMQHCKEIEEVAKERIALIIKQMAKAEGITEQLKAVDQMAWVGAMNNIKACAEEIVLSEIIYE